MDVIDRLILDAIQNKDLIINESDSRIAVIDVDGDGVWDIRLDNSPE
jgi:hypothetical protein